LRGRWCGRVRRYHRRKQDLYEHVSLPVQTEI
jgi:hypothetical protein